MNKENNEHSRVQISEGVALRLPKAEAEKSLSSWCA